MSVTGIHVLLTYACNLKCDHCFLHSSSTAKGTMTVAQVRSILQQAHELGTIQEIYFEGGEPFLYYQVMVEGIRFARQMGFKTGIVTNAYWATSLEDAKLWLKPLADLGLSDLSVSDDALHYGDAEASPPKTALLAAKEIGIPASAICKRPPYVTLDAQAPTDRGRPEISGGVKLRGRAVEKFAATLPVTCYKGFTKCPHEDLRDPRRVHVDCHGNVQLCQGVSMGCCWKTPLAQLVERYDADSHPISAPLLRGGPYQLMKEHGLSLEDAYVDECHLCYVVRGLLIDRFPEELAPRQVYGLPNR